MSHFRLTNTFKIVYFQHKTYYSTYNNVFCIRRFEKGASRRQSLRGLVPDQHNTRYKEQHTAHIFPPETRRDRTLHNLTSRTVNSRKPDNIILILMPVEKCSIYDNIIKVLSECSGNLENNNHIHQNCNVPGWNDLVNYCISMRLRDAFLL